MESVPLPILSPQGIFNLEKPISKKDVYAALMSMRSFKSSGKDGFQTVFLKKILECGWG